jgi:hypothetical protein
MIPNYPKHRRNNLKSKNGAVPIPQNFFKEEFGIKQKTKGGKHSNKDRDDAFNGSLEENHQWEQFFWTKQVVDNLAKSLKYQFVEKTCCLTTPSLAHKFHEDGRDEVLLDIDKRFDYLPKFHYYDITDPDDVDGDFRLLVMDPPFFLIPVEKIREAVDQITDNNYDTKIIISFLKRSEQRLRIAFKPYKLVPTKFQLEYVSIKPNKWSNFVLYSNIDLPGIKRIKED